MVATTAVATAKMVKKMVAAERKGNCDHPVKVKKGFACKHQKNNARKPVVVIVKQAKDLR